MRDYNLTNIFRPEVIYFKFNSLLVIEMTVNSVDKECALCNFQQKSYISTQQESFLLYHRLFNDITVI
jgi:hypothetical protein